MTEQLALEIGHEMAERAADHAGDEWKEIAFNAFRRHAEKNRAFLREDVRWACPDVPPPPDTRAWGHVALRAKREGIVRAIGYVPSTGKTAHGAVCTRWESLL